MCRQNWASACQDVKAEFYLRYLPFSLMLSHVCSHHLDCHATLPTVSQKRRMTPLNDGRERDYPIPFSIIDTHQKNTHKKNISKNQFLIKWYFRDHARSVPSGGLGTHSPESSKPDLWRSLEAPLFLCSWNFCLRCDGDTMAGGSDEGNVITGPLYGSLSTFSSLRVWNRDKSGDTTLRNVDFRKNQLTLPNARENIKETKKTKTIITITTTKDEENNIPIWKHKNYRSSHLISF